MTTTTATTTTADKGTIYDTIDAKLSVEKKDGGLFFTQKSVSAMNDKILHWLRAEFPDEASFVSALSYLSMIVMSSTASYNLYVTITRTTFLAQLVDGLPSAKSFSSFGKR